MRRKLDGVLLDVDGTLIDSNDAHARAWSDTLNAFGHNVSVEKIRPLIGMGGDKLLPAVGVDPESAEGHAIVARRSEMFLEHFVPKLRPTPGAKDLIQRLKREGLRLVIATSAGEEELDAMLRQVGLDDLIEQKTSADDAEKSKPDPDIILAALEKANLSPKAALLLGDTPYDVEAATRASVATVALLCGGWDADALRGAVGIYEDPADLLRHFTSSPFSVGA